MNHLEKRIKKLEDAMKKVLYEMGLNINDLLDRDEEEEENEENEEGFMEQKIQQERYSIESKDILDSLFDKDEYGMYRIGGISHQRLKEFKMYYKTYGKIAVPKNFINSKENLKMLMTYFDSVHD